MYKILVIDDDYAIRLLYQSELEDEGYTVMATSGSAGLPKHIRQFRPDIILLDIKCGEAGGLDVLKEIRSGFHHIPVILCSGYDSFLRDMRVRGADYCVPKSIDLTELKNTIKKAFGSLMKEPKKFAPAFHDQNPVGTYLHC